MATVYCQKCGSEVRGKFCTKCGTPVPAAAQAQTGGEASATTFLRAEDLLKMESLQTDERQSPPSPAPRASQSAEGTQPFVWPSPASQSEPGRLENGPSQTQYGSVSGDQGGPSANTYAEQPEYARQTGGAAGGPAAGAVNELIRPMSVGEIVSGAFRIVSTHAGQFLRIVVVCAAIEWVAILIFLGMFAGGLRTGNYWLAGLGGILALLVSIGAAAFPASAYIQEVERAGNGETLGIGEVMSRALTATPGLIVALILVAVAIIAGEIVAGIIGAILGAVLGQLGQFVGVVIGFCAILWLEVTLVFVPQASVLDGAGPVGSLGESRNLVTGDWWRTLGQLIVAVVIGAVIVIVAAIVIAILSVVLSKIPIVGVLIIGLLWAIAVALYVAYFISYTTLMFFDHKARKAGVAAAPAGSIS